MNFLQKIQKLPEQKRKAILWIIVIIIALSIFVFYIRSVQERLKSFKTEELREELKMPQFQEKLQQLNEEK